MLITINSDDKMNMKRDNVRIIRIILDSSLNVEILFYLELENGRDVI